MSLARPQKVPADLLAQLSNAPTFVRLGEDLAEMQTEVRAASVAWYARARSL